MVRKIKYGLPEERIVGSRWFGDKLFYPVFATRKKEEAQRQARIRKNAGQYTRILRIKGGWGLYARRKG